MLQSTKFLKQLQSIIVKRLIQTLQRLHEDDGDEDKTWQLHHVYNNVLKLGAVEDAKNKDKLAALVKMPTNQRNATTLDQVRGRQHLKCATAGLITTVRSILKTVRKGKSRLV